MLVEQHAAYDCQTSEEATHPLEEQVNLSHSYLLLEEELYFRELHGLDANPQQ